MKLCESSNYNIDVCQSAGMLSLRRIKSFVLAQTGGLPWGGKTKLFDKGLLGHAHQIGRTTSSLFHSFFTCGSETRLICAFNMLKEEKEYAVRELSGARGFFVSRVKASLAAFVLMVLVIILIVLAVMLAKEKGKEEPIGKVKKDNNASGKLSLG